VSIYLAHFSCDWLPIKRTETEGYLRRLRDAYYLIENYKADKKGDA